MRQALTCEFRLNAMFRRDVETGAYVGFCPSMQVYSQGESQEDAKESLRDALTLYLMACFSEQVLDRTMKDANFVLLDGTVDPLVSSEEYIRVRGYESCEEIDVILPLAIAEKGMSA